MNMQFKGFKPEAQQRIANTLGFKGSADKFEDFLNNNPTAKQQYEKYTQQAINMMNGGMVRKNYEEGGVVDEDIEDNQNQIQKDSIDRMNNPIMPTGTISQPSGTVVNTNQLISEDKGQITGTPSITTKTADVKDATAATTTGTNIIDDPRETKEDVKKVLDDTETVKGEISEDSKVSAEEQKESMVSDLTAAQGEAVMMNNPVQRELQQGELIEPAANAEKAAKFTEQIEAAQATPTKKATVKGQLENLMEDFEDGNTPAWASGAMRAATAQMAARGLGVSSMAGQALVQAAMEASLPIAQADASTVASFEMQNLSNRQQRAMLAAEQRASFMGQEFNQAFQARVANASKVSDIANMNFTAEQQIALENSRAANTMALNNLSNKQALVVAEAAALANLDMANLNNRQAAAVQNAQSFLAMDMSNLANEQQTEMFKAQQRVQSLFTDQAAVNATAQFNATSKNQTDQFFASLKTQTSQFNASQANAMAQFNAGEENAISKFTEELTNQREQFNAQNGLVIAQANATWRREIATADTAAINRANEINAQSLLAISNQAYQNLWQEHADQMEWAWTTADNERERQNNLALQHLVNNQAQTTNEYRESIAQASAVGELLSYGLKKGIDTLF
tara:strand:- start:2014 stop:3897 length:1884 start_codon:yes stop_codon:yes gene_type:complete